MFGIAWASLSCAACSGPIETRAGLQGAVLASAGPVEVVASPEQVGPLVDSARQAVVREMQRQGVMVSDNAEARIIVALAERPASLGVMSAAGQDLSSPKRRKLLQNCADRTQRLMLVAERPDGQVSRAWAEEYHCKEALAQTIDPLAAQAVASLVGRQGPGRALRFSRD